MWRVVWLPRCSRWVPLCHTDFQYISLNTCICHATIYDMLPSATNFYPINVQHATTVIHVQAGSVCGTLPCELFPQSKRCVFYLLGILEAANCVHLIVAVYIWKYSIFVLYKYNVALIPVYIPFNCRQSHHDKRHPSTCNVLQAFGLRRPLKPYLHECQDTVDSLRQELKDKMAQFQTASSKKRVSN